MSQVTSGVRRDYVPDPLGSTVALLDDSNNVTDTWDYWPYGEIRSRTGATSTPFQYVGTLGYFRDHATQTYVRARYYKQSLGRWQTVDSLWPRRTAYQYVSSRPVSYVDPSGLVEVGYSPVFDDNINPLAFGYGNCCGLNRRCNCSDASPGGRGIDCVDRACALHDQCAAGLLNYIFQQGACARFICALVGQCLSSGQCKQSKYRAECEKAGTMIMIFYCSVGSLPPGIFESPPFWWPPIPPRAGGSGGSGGSSADPPGQDPGLPRPKGPRWNSKVY